MRLKDCLDTSLDIIIDGITDDSRKVMKNYCFVVTNGFNQNHYKYVDDAIKNGCCVIVADFSLNVSVPVVVVNNVNKVYHNMCIKFYHINFNDFFYIGVTGTDGKTSTASIIYFLMDNFAYIGTNGLKVCDSNFQISNTTPCIDELCFCLKKAKDYNVNNIVMEVSSEGLLHKRLDGIKFNALIFTNVTGDHMNVHETFDNYLNCKLSFLDSAFSNSFVIVNGDDCNLRKIKHNNLYSVGFGDFNSFVINNVKYQKDFTLFSIEYKGVNYNLKSPYKGKFNIYNVSFAFVTLYLLGYDSSFLINKIKFLPCIEGRCEFLEFGQDYKIVLDYAHTINGVKNILDTFSSYKNIIVVSGCAGGRDKSKRKIIGKLLVEKSSLAIFTTDDPRFECVDSIIEDMSEYVNDFIKIIDRADAICYALDHASKDSIVLILGKGRDKYIYVEDKKVPYCDYDVVENYFLG